MHVLNPKLWVKQYSNTLFRYAIVRINDREIAKDLVQDTFLSALKNIENFRGEISEKNWLFTILKNKIIDHYRKKASSLITEIDEMMEEIDTYYGEEHHWSEVNKPKNWGIDYDSSVETKEFYEILNKCLGKLSELMRIVFSMKYLDEKESDEICKELSITSSNYWVVLHRAKLQLRACIEKKWLS